MPHVILDLDETHDPTKRDLTVSVDPDDATVFEIRDQDGGPLVGLGYLAVLSAPGLFRRGAFPVIAERLFPDEAAE